MRDVVKNLLRSENGQISSDAARFVMAGVLNVLLSIVIYQLALFLMGHKLAYLSAWLIGIIYVVVVYPHKVFPGGASSSKKNLVVVVVYIAVFFVSYLSLNAVVEAGVNQRLAIFIVVAISTVLNFFCMRFVYRFR